MEKKVGLDSQLSEVLCWKSAADCLICFAQVGIEEHRRWHVWRSSHLSVTLWFACCSYAESQRSFLSSRWSWTVLQVCIPKAKHHKSWMRKFSPHSLSELLTMQQVPAAQLILFVIIIIIWYNYNWSQEAFLFDLWKRQKPMKYYSF